VKLIPVGKLPRRGHSARILVAGNVKSIEVLKTTLI